MYADKIPFSLRASEYILLSYLLFTELKCTKCTMSTQYMDLVCVSYQVLDAAQDCCGEDACEEGHEVQAGEGPN